MKLLALFLLLSLSSCSVFDSEQNLNQETVLATAIEPKFYILNKTENEITYILIETENSHLVDLDDPCRDFKPMLEAGSNTSINYSNIARWEKDAKSVFFYGQIAKDQVTHKPLNSNP